MERPDLPLPDVSKARAAERATSVAAHLDRRFRGQDSRVVLDEAINRLFRGRITLVSSFGAESAALISLVAEVDRSTPVTFVDTGQLFVETLQYRDALVDLFGLTDVRTITPDPVRLAKKDPENFLWQDNPELCCSIRKVEPLARALEGFPAWISGRKRFQGGMRSDLPIFESDGPRVKINPLAEWSAAQIKAYAESLDLPEHPLVRHGFLSVGCMPCTTRVKPGEDARAGRWRGLAKTECGIHLPNANVLEQEGSGI